MQDARPERLSELDHGGRGLRGGCAADERGSAQRFGQRRYLGQPTAEGSHRGGQAPEGLRRIGYPHTEGLRDVRNDALRGREFLAGASGEPELRVEVADLVRDTDEGPEGLEDRGAGH